MMPSAGRERFALRLALAKIEDADLLESVLDAFDEARRACEAGTVDVVLLAARRLACIYEVLRNAGMPPISGSVVSDRVLDLHEEGRVQGRRVLVIDDCVILGRTITALESRLRASGAKSVELLVICGDEEQMSPTLSDDLNLRILQERSTTATQRFTLNLVQVLYTNLVPYLFDFPITKRLSLDASGYLAALELPTWTPVDTTPALLSDRQQATYSLVPTPEERRRLESDLSLIPTASLGPIKIRVFLDYEGMTGTAVFVPIVLLRPMNISEVEASLAQASHELDSGPVLTGDWRSWTPDAKYRLLQMYASVIALRRYWGVLKEAWVDCPVLRPEQFNLETVRLHFGKEVTSQLVKGLNLLLNDGTTAEQRAPSAVSVPSAPRPLNSVAEADWRVNRSRELAMHYLSGLTPSLPEPQKVLRLGETFVRPLAGIFGVVGQLERRKRAVLRKRPVTERDPRWLNEGISLEFLAHAVSGADAELIASLAIDVCNDLGITVPMACHDQTSETVGRKYRIGENVYLAFNSLAQSRRRGSWINNVEQWLVLRFASVVETLTDIAIVDPVGFRHDDAEALLTLVSEQATAGLRSGADKIA